jgi:hypothetical protein
VGSLLSRVGYSHLALRQVQRGGLYTDVHVRWLELIGIGPPLSQQAANVPADLRRDEAPTELATGTVLPPAHWYRIDA